MSAAASESPGAHRRSRAAVFEQAPPWLPLAVLTFLAAVLRLSTLGLQSFWFDEAFTPVNVLHHSLSATLDTLTKTENSPPLWYVLEWISYRLLGSGEWALRLPSALAGIALVPVAWGIGRRLAGRAAAAATAALVAVGPIFVWYSQEARVYGLYTLAAGVLVLCFLRFLEAPDRRGRVVELALAGAFALLTHYFTFFLLAGIALWLLAGRAGTLARRRALPALGAIAVVGLALIPLIASQGGRNTNWIGKWALGSRLQAIPQYFLTGYDGAPLGHGIELLIALPLIGACALGLWRSRRPLAASDGVLATVAGSESEDGGATVAGSESEDGGATVAASESEDGGATAEASHRSGAVLALWLTACGFVIPLALALAGADYLAPRNVLGAMVPLAALIAVLGTWPHAGRAGAVLLWLGVCALLAITIDTELSPRLQRGDWRGIAREIPGAGAGRAFTTPLIGSAPLEHYIPGLQRLAPHETVTVDEIVATGEGPLPAGAEDPPAGFKLIETRRANGIYALRFASPTARTLSEEQLRRDSPDRSEPWVLVPGSARASR